MATTNQMDDSELREALREVRELAQRLESIASQFESGQLGSRANPVAAIYLKAKGRGVAARLTYDDFRDTLLTERVR